MSITAAEPDARANSAPNKDTAAASDRGTQQKQWKKEIHTPEAEYNANVPIDAIERDPANRVPTDDAVSERAASIAAVGLLQPIVIRLVGAGKYQLMAGETRWRAFQLLKRKTIAARIYKDQSDIDAAAKALVENAQRSDLTAIERAQRFRQLELLGMKQKEIGALAGGVSQPVVANALRLLDLPESIQALVSSEDLSEAHGVNLAKFAKWPRVCERMARFAIDHEFSAKALLEEGLPFANQLVQDRLIEKICIKDRYYSDGVVYKLPRQFYSHRDFIIGEHYAYYVLPENPKDNVWIPVRDKQDAERKQAADVVAKKEAAALAKTGGRTDEQLERAKTLAKNKAIRVENALGLKAAFEKLKQTPAPTSLLLAILASEALGGNYGGKRIEDAAAAVGVELPKRQLTPNCYGIGKVSSLAQMDVMDIARVAVATILGRETEYANRDARELPENAAMVKDSAVPPPNLGVGDLVEWERKAENGWDMVKKRGTIMSPEDYAKATGLKGSDWKVYAPVKLESPGRFDLAFNGIARAGLRVVRSATPGAMVKVKAAPVQAKGAAPTKSAKRAKKKGRK